MASHCSSDLPTRSLLPRAGSLTIFFKAIRMPSYAYLAIMVRNYFYCKALRINYFFGYYGVTTITLQFLWCIPFLIVR